MMKKTAVLDHGYVGLVGTWGADHEIIEAARMSTGKGFLGWEGGWRCSRALCDWADKSAHTERSRHDACPRCGAEEIVQVEGDTKLLRFLYENLHMTPFEMAGMTIEVQAPIFVFREWHRHRTQSYNEMSARYAPLPDVNYVPTVERLMRNANGSNKQANRHSGAKELTVERAEWFRNNLIKRYEQDEEFYQIALSDGVPKELARIHLPVGRYSRMRASANLRNWLAFLALRDDANAQWEIQQFARAVGALVNEKFPRTYGLFKEGR